MRGGQPVLDLVPRTTGGDEYAWNALVDRYTPAGVVDPPPARRHPVGGCHARVSRPGRP